MALASFYQGKYKIGDSITLNEEGTNEYALKTYLYGDRICQFKWNGFDDFSCNSNSGRDLSAYAVVMPKHFSKFSLYSCSFEV